MKKFNFLFIALCVALCSKAQDSKFEAFHSEQLTSIDANIRGLTAALNLGKDQQEKWKNMEISFLQQMQDARTEKGPAKERSAKLRNIYNWREQEVKRILSAAQLNTYLLRQQQIITKVKALQKEKEIGMNTKPVMVRKK